jgi:hypothetical protein
MHKFLSQRNNIDDDVIDIFGGDNQKIKIEYIQLSGVQ